MADLIDDCAIDAMRTRGGSWAAYRNEDLGHPNCGHLAFMCYGEGCTFAEPLKQHPDTVTHTMWRYQLVGRVNLTERTIESF